MKLLRKPVNLYANRSKLRTYTKVLRTNTTDGWMDVKDGSTKETTGTNQMERTVRMNELMEGTNQSESTDVPKVGPLTLLAHSGQKDIVKTTSNFTRPEGLSIGWDEPSVERHEGPRLADKPVPVSPCQTCQITYPRDSKGRKLCGYKPISAPQTWPFTEWVFEQWLEYVRRFMGLPISDAEGLKVLEDYRGSFTPDELADLRLTVFRVAFTNRCREAPVR